MMQIAAIVSSNLLRILTYKLLLISSQYIEIIKASTRRKKPTNVSHGLGLDKEETLLTLVSSDIFPKVFNDL